MNQLLSADETNIVSINDSAEICALHQIFSWYRYLKDAEASKFSNRTLTYKSLIHISHTPYLVHPLHFYHLVPAAQIFTYETSDPPSPSHDSSSESVTPKGNPITRKDPPNPVPNVPSDPESNTSLSDSYSLSLSDSSDDA